MNRQEKYDKLTELAGSVTGSLKNPVSGVYLNCLKTQANEMFGHPEAMVCLEDLQSYVADGGFVKNKGKLGKTWIPIRLQVWGKEAEREQVKEVEASQPDTDMSDDIPAF